MKNDPDNIVEFKRPDQKKPENPKQPFINLPFVTKNIIVGLIVVHCLLFIGFDADLRSEIFLTFGFVPYLWSDANIFGIPWQSYISPIT
jgi:hypothetical protein